MGVEVYKSQLVNGLAEIVPVSLLSRKFCHSACKCALYSSSALVGTMKALQGTSPMLVSTTHIRSSLWSFLMPAFNPFASDQLLLHVPTTTMFRTLISWVDPISSVVESEKAEGPRQEDPF